MSTGFNIHSLPLLFTAIIFFGLPLLVLFKSRHSRISKSFFILGSTSGLWQLSYCIAYNLTDYQTILYLIKIAYAGVIFIPAALYHFIVSFLNLPRKKTVPFFYCLFALYGIWALVGNNVILGVQAFPWGSRPLVGIYYTVFLPVWAVPFILSLRLLFLEYRKETSPYNRKRIKYFLITVPLVLASTVDYLPNYGINVYPFGFVPLLIFGISTAFFVIKYRLLDIEIIVKKISLTAVGFAVSMSIIYFGSFYLQPFFYPLLGNNWILLPIVISCGVGVGLLKFVHFVTFLHEEEISRKFFYRPILKKEAQRISAAKDMNELIIYLIRDFSSWVRLDYVGVFIWDSPSQRYTLARDFSRSPNRKKLPLNMILSEHNPLIQMLCSLRAPLVRSELEYNAQANVLAVEEARRLSAAVRQMYRVGAEICIPSFCEGNLLAVINLGHKLNPNEIITREDLEIFYSLASGIARTLHDFMLKKEKTRLIVASQNTVISAIEAKDPYTRGHTERVARLTTLIGEQLPVPLHDFSDGLYNLNWSAQLHDVGKIAIPDSILLKPGPLTEEERRIINQHPLTGLKIVTPVREWLGEDICSGILYHHENFDGTGYLSGQKGSKIHLFARIIRVADSFDAMTSDRPYRPALSREAAYNELRLYKGRHYDPEVVEVFERLYTASAL